MIHFPPPDTPIISLGIGLFIVLGFLLFYVGSRLARHALAHNRLPVLSIIPFALGISFATFGVLLFSLTFLPDLSLGNLILSRLVLAFILTTTFTTLCLVRAAHFIRIWTRRNRGGQERRMAMTPQQQTARRGPQPKETREEE